MNDAATHRAVLWDLDGTLADSTAIHWQSWQAALEPERVRITEADFLATFGQRNEEILRSWLGPGADAAHIQRVGERKELRYRALLAAQGLEPLPGAAEWVRRLASSGWRQAIASSAPRLNVQAMTRSLKFTSLLSTVVSAEDVAAGKPDPEVFLVAASRLGVPPNRCVVVEDAAAGVEAARRAGMACIGLGAGGLRADVAVTSLADLAPDVFDMLLASPLPLRPRVDDGR
jgi:beta-phosphoglucomutase